MKGEKVMENKQLIMDYNDKPSNGKWITLSFQHVFAMFSATVLVPILTGLPISIALFSSGIGTLIYILCTKGKVPMYLGSSFAYIAYINSVLYMIKDNGEVEVDEFGNRILNADGGRGALIAGVVAIGIVYCLVAILIKIIGTKWIEKLLPPIVVGPMIIIIGLCLAGSAVNNTGLTQNPNWKMIVVSISTLLITALLAIKGKGFIKIIPFLLGIVGGYLVAIIVNFLPGDQILNLTELKEVVTTPYKWFAIPSFTIAGWKDADLGAGIHMAKLQFGFVLSAIPIAFATICEHIGDHQVLSRITGHDYAKDPGLDKTLIGDGVATAVAGLIGSVPNTSYGENTAVVGMSKIGSVWVTGLAAILAILLSFCNVFTALIASIPSAVMGGICLILYGFIASNGLKVLIDNKTDMNNSRNVIIVSVMLIIGIGGAVLYKFTGMALASIFGIVLNLILPKEKVIKEETTKE